MTANEHQTASEAPGRCGFVAVLGAPNAGKSTLVNQMVGAKVSIVTHKVQTTRTRIRGVAIEGATQMILVDTPGIFAPRRTLDRAMVEAAWGGAADADQVLLLVDVSQWAPRQGVKGQVGDERAPNKSVADTRRIIEGLKKQQRQAVLVLNKIDMLNRETLLGIVKDLQDPDLFPHTFMISAETGDGVKDLMRFVGETLPVGPWLYPEDQLADLPMRMLAAELTREVLYLRVHDELPYQSTVETESWKRLRDGSARIEQVVYVQKPTQKAIVLGKGGRSIKEIGAQARKSMEEAFGHRVHLFLFVKVREKWAEDPERFREMGLEVPKA